MRSAFALLLLLASCPGPQPGPSPSPSPAPTPTPVPTTAPCGSEIRGRASVERSRFMRVSGGRVVHIFATRHAGLVADCSQNMTDHGGPVQSNPKIYLVLWGSSWNGSGDPDGVARVLETFYPAITGSSWLQTVGQYAINNAIAVVPTWQDTGSSPAASIGAGDIGNEAARAAAHFKDYSVNASYVIALPHGVVPNDGFGSQYCAWHSTQSVNGAAVAFTNLPYMPDAGGGCGADSVNPNGTLDGVTIVAGHEQAETETDPQVSAWYDSTGAEIGDKCAWQGLQDTSFGVSGLAFPTQPLWSNALGGCAQ